MLEVGAVRRVFNVAKENSLPSWFASIQMLMVGLTVGIIYIIERKNPTKTTFQKLGWLIISFIFIYLAADDGAVIHERVGNALKDFISSNEFLSVFPSYAWQLVFAPIFGAMGLFILFFLRKELVENKSFKFIILAFGIWTVAIVLDFFEGVENRSQWEIQQYIRNKFDLSEYTISHFSKVIEETLEMIGTTILFATFIHYLIHLRKSITINFHA